MEKIENGQLRWNEEWRMNVRAGSRRRRFPNPFQVGTCGAHHPKDVQVVVCSTSITRTGMEYSNNNWNSDNMGELLWGGMTH
jgi:hypothetical protein